MGLKVKARADEGGILLIPPPCSGFVVVRGRWMMRWPGFVET